MFITLGLVLTVGVLATIYPQHASADQVAGNGGIGGAGGAGGVGGYKGGNGVTGATNGPPGLASATCFGATASHNPNC